MSSYAYGYHQIDDPNKIYLDQEVPVGGSALSGPMSLIFGLSIIPRMPASDGGVITEALNTVDFNNTALRTPYLSMFFTTGYPILSQGNTVSPDNLSLALTLGSNSALVGNYIAQSPSALVLTLSGLTGFKTVYSVLLSAITLSLTLGSAVATAITIVRPGAGTLTLSIGTPAIGTAQILQVTSILLTLNQGSFSTIFVDTEEINPRATYTVSVDGDKTFVQAIRRTSNVKYSQSRN